MNVLFSDSFLLALSSEDDGATDGVPTWIELIPSGPEFEGHDGRRFRVSNPDRVITAFEQGRRPIVIDWEHLSERKIKERTEAAGWVEKLEKRENGSIWGKVNWSPKGRDDIRDRYYRFVSPAFTVRRDDKEIVRLKSVALVHEPNLFLEALNSENHSTGSSDLAERLATLLNMDSSEDDAVIERVSELLAGQSDTLLNDKEFVPRRDYELAVSRLNGLRDAEEDRLNSEIENTVDEVISAGDPSFTPANREQYLAMCRQEGGLERFRQIARPSPSRSLSKTVVAHRRFSDLASEPENNEILERLGVSSKILNER